MLWFMKYQSAIIARNKMPEIHFSHSYIIYVIDWMTSYQAFPGCVFLLQSSFKSFIAGKRGEKALSKIQQVRCFHKLKMQMICKSCYLATVSSALGLSRCSVHILCKPFKIKQNVRQQILAQTKSLESTTTPYCYYLLDLEASLAE